MLIVFLYTSDPLSALDNLCSVFVCMYTVIGNLNQNSCKMNGYVSYVMYTPFNFTQIKNENIHERNKLEMVTFQNKHIITTCDSSLKFCVYTFQNCGLVRATKSQTI